MAIPCNTLDLENKKFVECPENSGNVAVRTKICQDDGEAIKVDIGFKGVPANIYDEANVLEGVESIINTYTVPIGKKFDLTAVSFSGDNIARATVQINGSVKQKKRTWWTTGFNTEFNMRELILSEGDIVNVLAENIGTGTAEFNATIIGGEYDA